MAEKYTQEQQDQYLNYVREQQKGKLAPEQMAQYEEYVKQQMPVEEMGMGRKALDYGLRGLDYAGGLVRGSLAGGAELATGRDDLVSIEDVLKGKAPNSSEVMDKLGVGEMGKLSDVLPGMYSETGDGLPLQKGGWADITGRGAVGFASDVALDPLTYASAGITALGKTSKGAKALEAITTPLKKIAKPTGKSIYKSALGRIDEEAIKYGKEPVSDLLLKNNISGSAESVYNQMDTLAEKLVNRQKEILAEASQKGGTVSMSDAMKQAEAKVAALRAQPDPITKPIADALEAQISQYKALDPQLKEVASPLYKAQKQMYLEDVKRYRKQNANALRSGAQESTDMLPGQINTGESAVTNLEDVLGQKQNLIEAPNVHTEKDLAESPWQYSLMEIPQKDVNVKGGRSVVQRDNLNKLAQKQENVYQKVRGPESPLEPTQIEMLGTEIVQPHKIGEVPRQGFSPTPEGFQTSMNVDTLPIKPTRPQMPVDLTAAVTPEHASGLKTSLYKSLPKGTFQETMAAAQGVHPDLTAGRKLMAKGLKEETEYAVGRSAGADLENALRQTNAELGQILTSKDKQLAQAFIENRKPGVTQVAGGMMGAILSPGNAAKDAMLGALAGKEGIRAFQFTGPRTTVGKGLYNFGNKSSSIWDTLLRQEMIKKNQGE